jgi:hypothetical protein
MDICPLWELCVVTQRSLRQADLSSLAPSARACVRVCVCVCIYIYIYIATIILYTYNDSLEEVRLRRQYSIFTKQWLNTWKWWIKVYMYIEEDSERTGSNYRIRFQVHMIYETLQTYLHCWTRGYMEKLIYKHKWENCHNMLAIYIQL